MSNIDIKVNMMTAVTEALKLKRANSNLDHEKIMQHITNMTTKIRNKDAKIGMIAAASKALSIIEKNPKLTDKEVMKEVIKEFPNILEKIKE